MRSGSRKWWWWWVVVAVGLAVSGCRLVPGTEAEIPDWSHRFQITVDGEEVTTRSDLGGRGLLFRSSVRDFPVYWNTWSTGSDAVEGKAPIANILPLLDLEADGLPLDEQDRICLKDPIRFFDPETLEEVGAIEAGTCLEDGGETVLVFETR